MVVSQTALTSCFPSAQNVVAMHNIIVISAKKKKKVVCFILFFEILLQSYEFFFIFQIKLLLLHQRIYKTTEKNMISFIVSLVALVLGYFFD